MSIPNDTGVMPNHPIVRDLVVVIAAKLLVVIAASLLVFGPGQRPKVDRGSIETRLIGTSDLSPQSRSFSP